MSKSRVLVILLLLSLGLNFVLGALGGAHIYRRVLVWFRNYEQPEPGKPLAFYCSYDRMESLAPLKGEGKPLPEDSLYISSGIYSYHGNVYSFEKEGLYRLIVPFGKNRQVVVYKNDVPRLISSFSWMVTHGSKDNPLDNATRTRKLMRRKLTLTCGAVCNFVKKQLDIKKIQSREIHMVTLGQKNGFDDSHVMLEVLNPQTKKWELYDIDNNIYFTKDSMVLNYWDWFRKLPLGDFKTNSLSSDTRLDISGFVQKGYDFSMYMEQMNSKEDALLNWYKRVAGIPIIDNLYLNIFPAEDVKKYKNDAIPADSVSFFNKLYP